MQLPANELAKQHAPIKAREQVARWSNLDGFGSVQRHCLLEVHNGNNVEPTAENSWKPRGILMSENLLALQKMLEVHVLGRLLQKDFD